MHTETVLERQNNHLMWWPIHGYSNSKIHTPHTNHELKCEIIILEFQISDTKEKFDENDYRFESNRENATANKQIAN